jgi:hypothetical protein
VWALAEQLTRLDPRNPHIERAKLLLKNRLEILDSSKPLQKGQEQRRKDALETLASLLQEAKSPATEMDQERGEAVAGA